MAKKSKATAAPSGLSIGRSGNNLACSWKLGSSKYNAQGFIARFNNGPNINRSVGAKTTSRVEAMPLSDYYPNTDTKWTSFKFLVRGKVGSKWSAWSTKEYTFTTPPKPKLEATLSSEVENSTTFSWSIDWGETDKLKTNAFFTNYQWWTSLLPDSELDSDQVTEWQETGTTTDFADESSRTIDETEVFQNNYSYTRYFKMVARGPAGDSDPVYAKHVYAYPNPAKNVKASAVRLENGSGYVVSAQWTLDASKARPVDSLTVEYAIDTPVSSYIDEGGVRKTTLSVPSISSWTTAVTLNDSTDSNGDVDGISFIINGDIEKNKCIFVRVVAKHDNKTMPSEIVFADGGFGELTDPTALSVTVDDNLATVQVTNGSAITASFTGIYYRTATDPTPQLVGIWPARNAQQITVQLPESSGAAISFGAKTFVADYSPITPGSGVTDYALSNIRMESSGVVWDERAVPKPPSNITLTSPRAEVVRVTWDWSWIEANGVEISWANHDDAWESTDAPSTHNLENTRVSAWNIAGLEIGTWYFRIRLFKVDADGTTYGTYSDIKSIKMASSPATPVLTLSPAIISPDGKVNCYWAFASEDGDEQSQANICEAFLDSSGNVSYGPIVAKASNEQFKTLSAEELGWEAGTTHYLAVKIITTSGEESDNWSTPKPIQILEPIVASIDSTSLEIITVVDDEEQEITHQQLSLTEMPLLVTASGAGEGGLMTYIIERAADYHLDRPDEKEVSGFAGEAVAIIQKEADNSEGQTADYSVSIGVDDLIGILDDGAPYRLTAIARDSYGQTAEASLLFDVRWTHQAVEPSATIEVDNDEMIVCITPIQPETGYEEGDTCDIYRLSADRPELIVEGAEFGVKYVDPYPALSEVGGHRIVYKTVNGDYITEDNNFAWTDYDSEEGDLISVFATIIDFGDDRIVLPYDLSLSNKWNKDFTQTKYLGGSIKGDWNPAVERSETVQTRLAVKEHSEQIAIMRRLANYSDICHVRTPDGSSFAANVEVQENREEKKINMIASFSLDITRIDSEGFDGLTYAEWSKDE